MNGLGLGAADWRTHVIGTGESLSRIARKYGLTVDQLIADNRDELVIVQNQKCAEPMAPPACPYPLPIAPQAMNWDLVFADTVLRIRPPNYVDPAPVVGPPPPAARPASSTLVIPLIGLAVWAFKQYVTA